MSYWRNKANAVINHTLDTHKPQNEADARTLLRTAYPFGERAMHPYNIWLDAVKKAMHKRFPKQIDNNIGLFSEQ